MPDSKVLKENLSTTCSGLLEVLGIMRFAAAHPNPCLYPHMSLLPCVSLCALSCVYKDTSLNLGPTLGTVWPHVIWWHLQRTFFQIRANFEVLGGHQFQNDAIQLMTVLEIKIWALYYKIKNPFMCMCVCYTYKWKCYFVRRYNILDNCIALLLCFTLYFEVKKFL